MAILYLIATPIGNLQDISQRALELLGSLDILACEDTRHTGNLLKCLAIPRPARLVSNHEHNEKRMAGKIVEWLDAGQQVGLCSNAGYPGISDPGYPAIVAALEAGHEVQVIAGPCAATAALLCSGLPTSSYTFKGFPPRKTGARKKFLQTEKDSPHTLVIYESPFRIEKLLLEAYEILGDRRAAICLELTKKFERVQRGKLSELIELQKNGKIKGEAVVVIAGKARKADNEEDEAIEVDENNS